jgi:hypothetical protein
VNQTRRASTIAAFAGATASLTGAAALYWFLARPRLLRWGASDSEVARAWPGDELVERPSARGVRAVTIEALAAIIWPWIMQVGRDRGASTATPGWRTSSAPTSTTSIADPGLMSGRLAIPSDGAENKFGGKLAWSPPR